MNEREGYTGLGLILAFTGGALAGAAVAMLVAPTTGEEAREKLREIARAGKSKVQNVPKSLKSAYAQATDVAKEAFSESRREIERHAT